MQRASGNDTKHRTFFGKLSNETVIKTQNKAHSLNLIQQYGLLAMIKEQKHLENSSLKFQPVCKLFASSTNFNK